MTLNQLKRAVKAELSAKGVPDGDNTVLEMLFGHAFGFSRNFLLTEPGYEIDESSPSLKVLRESLDRVTAGEPIQHVTGLADFCALKFHVNWDVLIPRQETEILVKIALHRLKNSGLPSPAVLDLCCGSGAIGISVKNYFPRANVVLSDISEKALLTASTNAADILGSDRSVTFLRGDFLAPVLESKLKFDVFLSNPPYIKTSEMDSLPKNVRGFDPDLALDGGEDGITPYKKIIPDLHKILRPGALVAFEIGETESAAVSALLQNEYYEKVETVKDLCGKDRFVCATFRRPKESAETHDLKTSPEAASNTSRKSSAAPLPGDNVTKIPGIGPKSAEAFRTMGVYTVGDLAEFYPKRYENRALIKTIDDSLREHSALGHTEPATYRLRVVSVAEYGKFDRRVIVVRASDGNEHVKIPFFNRAYVKSQLFAGDYYYFYGQLTNTSNSLTPVPELVNPQFCHVSSEKAADFLKIHPIYRFRGSVKQETARKAVKAALISVKNSPDVPSKILAHFKLAAKNEALAKIHFPEAPEDVKTATKRLSFDEILRLMLKTQSLRSERDKNAGNGYAFSAGTSVSPLLELLPFSLTAGQSRAVGEILADMTSKAPMNRLVIGDVGSGKTVIALAAIYVALKNGTEAALMVPSTVLAEQHYGKIKPLLAQLGFETELLINGIPASERRRISAKIADKKPFLVIGTHTLIQENVNFGRLGLVVTDEQHRFGVNQRRMLIGSYETCPDVLSLSATPIPRTLALILYGDMDISYLKEKPVGRREIVTTVVPSSKRRSVYKSALAEVEKGRQVFIVHACIDDPADELDLTEAEASDKSLRKKLKSCTENYRELSETVFSGKRTALLHGKMKEAEKNAVMSDFAAGKIDILFSTTVIEVGIDVPNATLMIIENAERFGLSQLHQLRGRVGRGSIDSSCVLISEHAGDNARLDVIANTTDGFKIADEDLKLRGPGELFGTEQSGLLCFKLSNPLEEPELIEDAKKCASLIISEAQNDPNSESAKYLDKILDDFDRVVL